MGYNVFKHPQNVCMTYVKHMRLSLFFSFHLWLSSVKAFVHAFIPDVFITSTTDVTNNIQSIMKNSGCHS